MDIKEMLHQVRDGALSVEEAEKQLKNLPYEDLGYAKLDLHRKLRSGFPETVFCQGKPDEFLAEIFKKLYQENGGGIWDAGIEGTVRAGEEGGSPD